MLLIRCLARRGRIASGGRTKSKFDCRSVARVAILSLASAFCNASCSHSSLPKPLLDVGSFKNESEVSRRGKTWDGEMPCRIYRWRFNFHGCQCAVIDSRQVLLTAFTSVIPQYVRTITLQST